LKTLEQRSSSTEPTLLPPPTPSPPPSPVSSKKNWGPKLPSPSKSYNYSRSTEDNYATAPGSEENGFHGDFAAIRATLDYSYHKHYSRARQAVQDEITRAFLRTVVRDSQNGRWCERPSTPWVVFTAGAMGAGKSRAMRWVAERGYFPLASFVQVDPDAIRYQLPEMSGYLARDQGSAGKQTQKEAGFIQEVLTLEGLKRGKNVMVDGSLRDAEWNKGFFARVRALDRGSRSVCAGC
jgi:hypothetical protein